MAYFKIGEIDFSKYVNQLTITKNSVYNQLTNAAGNTVVDLISAKREIVVGIIPLEAEAMEELQKAIDTFNVSISIRNPKTNELEENINCILPTAGIDYYTIQVNKVSYKAFTLTFIEL